MARLSMSPPEEEAAEKEEKEVGAAAEEEDKGEEAVAEGNGIGEGEREGVDRFFSQAE